MPRFSTDIRTLPNLLTLSRIGVGLIIPCKVASSSVCSGQK